jgi:hypothetical protein
VDDAEAKAPTLKPDLVERLCAAVEHLTAERAARSHGPQWIMVPSVARYLGISEGEAQQAGALAVQRHWIQTDGSDALTGVPVSGRYLSVLPRII